jgi:hypothetical protein
MASSKIVSQFGPRLEWHEAKSILARLNPWNQPNPEEKTLRGLFFF